MRYRNPPLTEAVCEFRFTPDSAWDLAIPGLIYARLERQYPKRSQSTALQSRIVPTSAGVQQEIQGTERVRFTRDDDRVVVQLSPHFLALNHIAPYSGWEKFRPMIDEVLAHYRDVAQPTGLDRIGLRFVNVIKFPEYPDAVNLEDFFDFYPHVGKDLPQQLGAFLCGVNFDYAGGRDVMRAQLANVAKGQQEVAIQLDLDYHLARPGIIAFDALGDWLEQGHAAVENVFEGAITERLRQSFGPNGAGG